MIRAALLVAILQLPALAAAQDARAAIEASRAALESGDLIGAGTAVDRGLALGTLSRDELTALYELRALLAYADDRLGLLEESLEALAALEVDTPADFPPPLRARYVEIARVERPIELSIELVAEVREGHRSVRLVPVASGDRGRLVRALRVRAAVNDEALAPIGPDDVLDAGDPHTPAEIRYLIEALGPGGTLVASRGATETPDTELLDALPVDQTFLHVMLVTVSAVLVAAAVSFGMAYLATDGFTAGQPTTLGPITCTGAPCVSAPLLSF